MKFRSFRDIDNRFRLYEELTSLLSHPSQLLLNTAFVAHENGFIKLDVTDTYYLNVYVLTFKGHWFMHVMKNI